MEKTTIQVNVNTLDRLRSLKRFERESYDEVINFVVDDYEDEELTNEEIDGIKMALDDVKENGTVSFADVMKEAGISLN